MIALSARECEILPLLCDRRRLTVAEVAAELCISPDTVRAHVKHIHVKLDVGSRRELVRRAITEGLVQ